MGGSGKVFVVFSFAMESLPLENRHPVLGGAVSPQDLVETEPGV